MGNLLLETNKRQFFVALGLLILPLLLPVQVTISAGLGIASSKGAIKNYVNDAVCLGLFDFCSEANEPQFRIKLFNSVNECCCGAWRFCNGITNPADTWIPAACPLPNAWCDSNFVC